MAREPKLPGDHAAASGTKEALVRAMSGRDAAAQQPVVERTRRAVRIADQSRREQGELSRRSMGAALFVIGAVLLVLAPALWSGVDDFLGGEHFGDLPTQVALLSTLLLMAIVAALAAGWRTRTGREDVRRDQRNLLH